MYRPQLGNLALVSRLRGLETLLSAAPLLEPLDLRGQSAFREQGETGDPRNRGGVAQLVRASDS